jgi:S1-C subfamily serine protease
VSDPSKDLALLKLPLRNLPYLSLADSNFVHVLNTVYVLGYPLTSELGHNVSASEGKINGIRREGRVFQFDADVNPGNIGGPLLNDKGEVTGVVVAKLDAIKMLKEQGSLPERINFAIPVNEARELVGKALTELLSKAALRRTAPIWRSSLGGSRQTLNRAKCSLSSGTRMAMPNSTFRRCYGKGVETLRPSCVLSRMVRTA